MARKRAPRKITPRQQKWLDRIALNPVMVTRDPDFGARYSLTNGATIGARTVAALISRGLIVPQADGLFAEMGQTFVIARQEGPSQNV